MTVTQKTAYDIVNCRFGNEYAREFNPYLPYFSGEIFTTSNDKNSLTLNGISQYDWSSTDAWESYEDDSLYLFGADGALFLNYVSTSLRIYSAQIITNNVDMGNYIPAIDSTGEPCMYDKVSKQSFYNSNEGSSPFIIGVDTKIQLRAIVQSLPDNTDNYIENEDGTQTPVVKTLVISIPADWLGEGDVDSWLSGDFGQEIQQYASDTNWTLQFNTH